MRISDWSSDVCSSDLAECFIIGECATDAIRRDGDFLDAAFLHFLPEFGIGDGRARRRHRFGIEYGDEQQQGYDHARPDHGALYPGIALRFLVVVHFHSLRSEEHTSELHSLMRISYAVFCLKKKNKTKTTQNTTSTLKE